MTTAHPTRRQLLLAGAALAAAPRLSAAATVAGRIVVAGGALTEIVVALGAAARLAGVDTTSLYPPAVVGPLPKIGYFRSLGAEGILSLDPAMLIASDQAGPPATIAQLRSVGLPVVLVPEPQSADAVPDKIRAVARALEKPADGATMADSVATDLATMRKAVAALADRPRVLFVMSTSSGRIMAAGRDTAADLMIQLAGGRNAIRGFAGYKPLTPEAALADDPDIVLLPQHSFDALGGKAGVLRTLPALTQTAAARSGRLHALDMLYLLGLGPRIAHAARDLAMLFHPGAVLPDLPKRSWA